jgi:hypothetical protein
MSNLIRSKKLKSFGAQTADAMQPVTISLRSTQTSNNDSQFHPPNRILEACPRRDEKANSDEYIKHRNNNSLKKKVNNTTQLLSIRFSPTASSSELKRLDAARPPLTYPIVHCVLMRLVQTAENKKK